MILFFGQPIYYCFGTFIVVMIFFLIPASILNPECSAGSNQIVDSGLNLVVALILFVLLLFVCLCYCCCGGRWVAAVSWLVVEPDGTVRASPPTLQLLHLLPTLLQKLLHLLPTLVNSSLPMLLYHNQSVTGVKLLYLIHRS